MRVRSSRQFITFVAIAALMLQSFFALTATYQVPTPQQASGLSSLFGDKLLICTAEGFKWVSLKDIQSGKSHPAPHTDYQCPVCYLSAQHASHQLTLGNAYLLVERLYHIVPALLRASLYIPHWQLAGNRLSRAPPLS